MTSVMPSMNPISYSSLVQSGSKIYVPVSANEVIYTQFDHISGYAIHTPSQENNSEQISQNGISISKIKILNTLIDQLVSLKADKTRSELPTELTDEQVDSLIKDFQDKIQIAINNAKNNPFAFDGAQGFQTGLVLNTSV
mgnify:CR=1 FL=1